MSAVVATAAPVASLHSTASSSNVASAEPASKRSKTIISPDHSDRVVVGNSKSSPLATRSGPPPLIQVKKEPGSPALVSSRPRPKRLDLSTSALPSVRGPQTARPLTSRESAGLAIQDVGLACLSPGFQTNDPSMREQLQRSMDVRDQQRQIIEARQKGAKPGALHESADISTPRVQDTTLFGVPTSTRPLNTSRRKGPPPMLSINAPSAASFANDRVIQSAPLHQTFTGLQPGEFPRSRHGPSNLSQTSHIHHAPANQTNNRLPPISDVFANDRLDAPRPYAPIGSPSQASQSHPPPPIASPGFPPPSAHSNNPAPFTARPREFRSAEEAVHSLSGGRDELMPKLLHYGGVQPPTPPSPIPGAANPTNHLHHSSSQQHLTGPHGTPHQQLYPPGAENSHDDIRMRTVSMNGRRRPRDEFERDNGSSPPPAPSFHGPASFLPRAMDHHKRGPISRDGDRDREDDWRAGMSNAEKREEFLRLCERAWDLFHS